MEFEKWKKEVERYIGEANFPEQDVRRSEEELREIYEVAKKMGVLELLTMDCAMCKDFRWKKNPPMLTCVSDPEAVADMLKTR